MEIAGAIVSFVGLSGQVLQGCNFLCKFFFDASDAPELIIAISIELCAVRSRLQAFRLLLLEIQATSPASLTVQQDPAVPLQSCQDAIQKLQTFVDRYADLSISTVTTPGSSQTSRAVVRRAWHKLEVARKGPQLRSHKSQLEAAKTSLLAAQAGIQLALELQQLKVTREAQRSLQQLQDEHTASAQVVKDTRTLATDIRTLHEDNRLLTKVTNMSLNQVVSDTQTLLTQSTLSEQSAHNAKVASKFTQDAIAVLSTDFKKGLEDLPAMLAPIIQNTIAKSLAEHNASGRAGIVSTDQICGDMSTKFHKGSSYNDEICSLPGRKGSERTPQRRQGASSTIHLDSPLVRTRSTVCTRDLFQAAPSSIRGPKRQQTSKSIFNVWFGKIEITTSVTEQEDDVGSDYIFPMRLQARRTSFKLLPSPWFGKIGLLFESGHSRPTISHPGWDNRLRVLRTHQRDSAVCNAIKCADYVGFRQLLERREITPFDLAENDSHILEPLFGIVVNVFCKCAASHDLAKQTRLLDIARLLADSGVDCGVGRSLYFVILSMMFAPNDLALSLFRIIMTQSQSDPFEGSSWTMARLEVPDSKLSVIVKQDEWDLSEFRTLFEDYWGNGSFGCMVEKGSSDIEWRHIQKQRWRQKPAPLRRSRSHCLAEFGWTFVAGYWGKLCWLDERPTFWQSRQACEAAFGKWFMDFSWPGLYWKEELPSFRRSREACLEAFGELFVYKDWPELYWRQELPTFWQSRKACLEEFRYRFVEELWPKCLGKTCFEVLEGKGAWGWFKNGGWRDMERNARITQMMTCWSREDATLRHSRQHCIDQYGTNFVQDELPALLRRGGLPEEDVLRLTEYSPDMEPPAPCPYWEVEDRPCPEHKKPGANEGERVRNNDSDGDSDSETSDGWETADEDYIQLR